MTQSEFLACVEELVNAPSGTLDLESKIDSIDGFDSMTVIGLISVAESKGRAMSIEEFGDAKNLADVYALMGKN